LGYSEHDGSPRSRDLEVIQGELDQSPRAVQQSTGSGCPAELAHESDIGRGGRTDRDGDNSYRFQEQEASKRHQSDQYFGAKLRDAVETHEETVETHEENWPTATTRDWKDSTSTVPPSRANPSKQTLGQRVAHVGLLNQGSPNTNGKHQESWATPRANKVHPTITEENREQLANRGKSNLEEDVAGHCGKATGKLNPAWVEQLMGLPTGWTDLDYSATE
jgi:hypothetical protein